MNDVTIVSALFNIGREYVDGRKWEEYLKWFEGTLKLKCPMVLFVTEDVRDFIEKRRLYVPTTIIIQNIEDIPYYYLKDKIDNILISGEYKNKISDPNRLECKHSIYSILIHSKFKWMEIAIEENPYNSKYFFWMDAGASRFFDGYDLFYNYPSSNALKALNEMGNGLLVQMNMEYYDDIINSKYLSKEYLLDNRSFIPATLFGGRPKSIKKISKYMENIFVNEMLGNGFVNNEQIALGYLVKQNPDDYEIYERYDGKHMSLFLELGKR